MGPIFVYMTRGGVNHSSGLAEQLDAYQGTASWQRRTIGRREQLLLRQYGLELGASAIYWAFPAQWKLDPDGHGAMKIHSKMAQINLHLVANWLLTHNPIQKLRR